MGADASADLGAEVAVLANDFPGWHVWVGVGGDLFYARRPRSSLPIVKRDKTLEGLRKQLDEFVSKRDIPRNA
jgi:hypothetical protein